MNVAYRLCIALIVIGINGACCYAMAVSPWPAFAISLGILAIFPPDSWRWSLIGDAA